MLGREPLLIAKARLGGRLREDARRGSRLRLERKQCYSLEPQSDAGRAVLPLTRASAVPWAPNTFPPTIIPFPLGAGVTTAANGPQAGGTI
jgi:hypothetical protein